ncbi:MAG: molybdopterin biosynthesis protein [Planctomycetes bacterium]|nr:molybdopterin biosynthesis protein [Planctomycetota bacterium]
MAETFLAVIDADEAHRRFHEAIRPEPLGEEFVGLDQALGRILARAIASPIDVPGFDRSNVDGFALRAADTFGAEEATPVRVQLMSGSIAAGDRPLAEVPSGHAQRIATGGMMPRGADAVAMVEHVHVGPGLITVQRALTPSANVSFAGSDIGRGETVLWAGTMLTARETGTLAALGLTEVPVYRKPRVAVFSTGNEIVAPGTPLAPGQVYDSNLRILSDRVREIGCEPVSLGVIPDQLTALTDALQRALACDAVVFSGGTSKGEGDLGVQAVRTMATVLCHGVALKPGKPLCLAAAGRVPIAVLPGFPTSAVFTFQEFVAPVLRALAGAANVPAASREATMPMRVNAEKGRAEFVLVGLHQGPSGLVAYPMGRGSGSVTTFARADGFITLGRQRELIEAGERVSVRLLADAITPVDLVVIGSHCVGLDLILSLMRREGFSAKTMSVGSQGGFLAAGRGECDLAGVHLCDDAGVYNTPFLPADVDLVPGYRRMQGVVFRASEPDLARARMVNRNRGSGTRVLIDALLGQARPEGYHSEARSHNAVAASVAQGRADWGVAIEPVARLYGLGFRALREERYDFAIPRTRASRPAVAAFQRILVSEEARAGLRALGFTP